MVETLRPPSRLQKVATILGRRRGTEACLVICPGPADLDSLLFVDGWRSRFSHVVAWIIDSFWTEQIPAIARYGRVYDHLFTTGDEESSEWEQITGTPTTWLPWGSDALRFAGQRVDRVLDLLRTGRQPPEWDDDDMTANSCRSAGINFQGRPPACEDADANQQLLMTEYAKTKFSLAFSSLVSPAPYTHPTRDYLTARWTDALAAGAVVAGIAPRVPSARRLLWAGATLELGTVARDEGIRVLRDAVRAWRPEHALRNRKQALERLDWRWRFRTLASALGVEPYALGTELKVLCQLLEQGGAQCGAVRRT